VIFHVPTRRFTAQTARCQHNRRGMWAWFACVVEPCPAVEGTSVTLSLPKGAIPHEFIPSLLGGFERGRVEMADCGEWFCSMKIDVVQGKYHDVDSTPEAFAVKARLMMQDLRHYLIDVRGLRSLDPAWRTPDVLALARHAHREREHEALPMLADALEEAGCDFALLLEHCRSECDHGESCWAVQLTLAETG
jgi:hypothetical protein